MKAVLALFAFVALVSAQCGSGSAAPMTYVRSNYAATCSAAETACVAMGGHLASIHNTAQNSQVLGVAAGSDVWIGYHDLTSEGSFQWTDASCTDFSNWAPGEPNNWGSTGEDCVEMYAGSYATGMWNDYFQTVSTLYFVCQIPTSTFVVTFNQEGAVALSDTKNVPRITGEQDLKGAESDRIEFAANEGGEDGGDGGEEKGGEPEPPMVNRAEIGAEVASNSNLFVAAGIAVPVLAVALFAGYKLKTRNTGYATVTQEEDSA